MEDVTRAFLALMARSEATPAQWAHWHLQRLGELAADPVTRLELHQALRESAALREQAEVALENMGDLFAEAALEARRDFADRMMRREGEGGC